MIMFSREAKNRMGVFRNYRIFSIVALIVALLWCFSPVLADNSSVSIAYRGAGGNYIGDAIIFDGYNSVSNMTVLRVTGPGLSPVGVPVYDLNGVPGTGNPVEVNSDGSWKFVWYTGSIKGVDKMQTARYYITAFDLSDPSKSATTSIMMKKPDFYIVPTPNPVETGDYIQLLGTAEGGTPDVRIEIRDQKGTILHIYDTAATETGYFNYGFHIDMAPGDYPVTISSATMKASSQIIIHVIPPQTQAPGNVSQPGISPVTSSAITPVISSSPATSGMTVAPVSPVTKNPEPGAISPLAIIAGLIVAGLVVVLVIYTGKKYTGKKN
jgi:hypothetical protein